MWFCGQDVFALFLSSLHLEKDRHLGEIYSLAAVRTEMCDTANKDEIPINALDDMRRFMHMEMQEETRPIYDTRDLTLWGLHHYRGKYEFPYTIRLPITADRLSDYHEPGEFTQLIGLTPEEAKATDLRGLDAYRFNRGHLHDIVVESLTIP